MNKILLIVAAWPLLFWGAAGCVSPAHKMDNTTKVVANTNAVIIYDHGNATSLEKDNSCFESIITNSLKLLATSDDAYKLIVSPSLIESQKEGQKGVEITFAEPKKVEVERISQTYNVSKIYIPITGKFAGDKAVIFFGDPDYFDANQFINFKDVLTRNSLVSCINQ